MPLAIQRKGCFGSGFFAALRQSWRSAGSSLVTGASDSDPSAVVSCLQVGATTGLSLVWLFPVTTVALIWLDALAFRFGTQQQQGIARLARSRLGFALALAGCGPFVAANLLTLAADVAGASHVLGSLAHLPSGVSVAVVVVVPSGLLLRGKFVQLRAVLLLATPLYLLYLAAAGLALRDLDLASLNPLRQGGLELALSAVAVFGAVLTPYVFFWQVEDSMQQLWRSAGRRLPTPSMAGMLFANVILLAVLLTAAGTLYAPAGGGLAVSSLDQASDALRPLLGRGAFACFSIGLLASTLIAVPIIAATNGYIVGGIFGRRAGLNWPLGAANGFYAVCLGSLLAGGGFALLDINPVRPLFYAQVLNGASLPLLVVLLARYSGSGERPQRSGSAAGGEAPWL